MDKDNYVHSLNYVLYGTDCTKFNWNLFSMFWDGKLRYTHFPL